MDDLITVLQGITHAIVDALPIVAAACIVGGLAALFVFSVVDVALWVTR